MNSLSLNQHTGPITPININELSDHVLLSSKEDGFIGIQSPCCFERMTACTLSNEEKADIKRAYNSIKSGVAREQEAIRKTKQYSPAGVSKQGDVSLHNQTLTSFDMQFLDKPEKFTVGNLKQFCKKNALDFSKLIEKRHEPSSYQGSERMERLELEPVTEKDLDDQRPTGVTAYFQDKVATGINYATSLIQRTNGYQPIPGPVEVKRGGTPLEPDDFPEVAPSNQAEKQTTTSRVAGKASKMANQAQAFNKMATLLNKKSGGE